MEPPPAPITEDACEAEIAELEAHLYRDEDYRGLASYARFLRRHPPADPPRPEAETRMAYLGHLRKLAWLARADEIEHLEAVLRQVPLLQECRESYVARHPKPLPRWGDPLHDTDPDTHYLKFLRSLDQVRLAGGDPWWRLLNT